MEMRINGLKFVKNNPTGNTIGGGNPYLGSVISEPADLKSLTGSYDDTKSLCENIFDAINAGTFPTANDYPITFNKLTFSFPPLTSGTLPANVILDDCVVASGTLEFSKGKLTATNSGIAHANGPDATSYAFSKNATAHASNRASAYAKDGGTSMALNEFSQAHAEGEKSVAYGMTPNTTIHANNHATAITVCNNVNVYLDRTAHTRFSKLNEKAPAYTESDGTKRRKFVAYVYELNDMAKAGNKDAAYELGMIDDSKMSQLATIPESKRRHLELAHKLGHEEAAFALGEYFRKQKKNPEMALKWYEIVQYELGDMREEAGKNIKKIQKDMRENQKKHTSHHKITYC